MENEIVLPEDAKKLRLIFEKMPKAEIREVLLLTGKDISIGNVLFLFV